VIPPLPPPPAIPAGRGEVPRRGQSPGPLQDRYQDYDYPEPAWRPDGYRSGRAAPGRARSADLPGGRGTRSPRLRRAVIIALILVVAAGVVAATSPFWHGHHSPPAAAGRSHPPSKPSTTTASVLKPAGASGYDPLTSPANDPGNENSQYAKQAIDGNPSTAWTSQYYDSPFFGNLKKGSGLIVDMGTAIRLHSIQVSFGRAAGADVQIKIGNTDVRSAAALASFTTVATADNVGGTYTFTSHSTTTGRYILIWFTKLPPDPGHSGQFMAQISNVIVRGSPS
jgi:hypothetical protein